ncbi:MAG: hypothetical protein M1838_000154 [Thelocarpon superellum]|nr:MAG: hypothetical protein M1838_000154 [Thelocarpon superellum]
MTNSSGVECYRHSVIQCLLHLPKFGNWLVQDHLPEGCSVDGVRNCILCHLRTLYTVYWSESRSQVSVRKALNLVYNALKNLGWAAGGEFEQQDADEFLTFLLGAIALRVDEIRDVLDQYRNKDVMNLLFGIQLRSFLHCKCKKTAPSITLDTDRSIRVGLGKARAKGTLHEYVKAHMSDDIDDYQCDGCHKRVRVTRQSTIHEAPEVLILSLRRFATSGSGTRKDDRRVRFTQWLDLGAHVTHPATQRPLKYRLVATINHRAGRITEPRRGARGGSRQSGDSLNAGGHYITAARGWNGKWSMLDDERVTSIESDVAAWPEKSRPGFTPYVLLYTRVA